MAGALGQHHQPLGPDRSGLIEPPHRGHPDQAVTRSDGEQRRHLKAPGGRQRVQPQPAPPPDRSTTPATGGEIEAATCRATMPPAEAPTRVSGPASWVRAQLTAAVVTSSHWSAASPGGHWEAPAPHWLNSSERTPLVLASQSA
jgi:hypothetical protein